MVDPSMWLCRLTRKMTSMLGLICFILYRLILCQSMKDHDIHITLRSSYCMRDARTEGGEGKQQYSSILCSTTKVALIRTERNAHSSDINYV